MRDRKTLMGIGDSCGGFVTFNRSTEMDTYHHWVRMKVYLKEGKTLGTMEVAKGQ